MVSFDYFLIIIPLVGSILGSFANVFIYRWPVEESVVSPRSRCRSCFKQILARDNIPIISWILLKGKCRFCKAKISHQYPMVEIIMSLMFLMIYLKMGLTITSVEYMLLIFGLITITVVDLKHFLIPDIFSLSGVIIGIIGSLINVDRSFMDSFIGLLIGGGFFLGYGLCILSNYKKSWCWRR